MGEIAREFFENSFQNTFGDNNVNVSSEAFPAERSEESQIRSSDASAYTLACDQSQMSGDVDLWIRGTPTASTGVQDSRAPLAQRSALSTDSYQRHISSGMWYILALILPFFTFNNYPHWRCSPSTVINTAELLLGNFGRACDRVRCNLRRLAQNQLSRELFATTMDIILVVYAVGFLILSMYQASMIG